MPEVRSQKLEASRPTDRRPPPSDSNSDGSTINYSSASFPEPFQILGLKLKPLSLGRYRLLRHFEVAFVADHAATAGLIDLLIGVLICSMTCKEFIEFSASTEFRPAIAAWSRRINRLPFLVRWPWLYLIWERSRFGKRWRARYSFDVFEKIALFQKFITDAAHIPPHTEENRAGAGGGNSSHWSRTIEIALRKELHWSDEEIAETSLNKAMEDYFQLAEMHGAIRLLTPEELAEAAANSAAFAAVPVMAGSQPATLREF